MSTWSTISLLLLIALFVAVFIVIRINQKLRRLQKRKWNNGRCRCGAPWTEFSNNQGIGKGFYCNRCDDYLWITFGGIQHESQRSAKKSL